jgi:hypothetical protein
MTAWAVNKQVTSPGVYDPSSSVAFDKFVSRALSLLGFDGDRVDEDEVVGGRVEDGHLKSPVAWKAPGGGQLRAV